MCSYFFRFLQVEVEVLKKDIEATKKDYERVHSLTQSLSLAQQQHHHHQQQHNSNNNDVGSASEQMRLKQQLQEFEKQLTSLTSDHKILRDSVAHRATDVTNEVDGLRKEVCLKIVIIITITITITIYTIVQQQAVTSSTCTFLT